MTKTNQIRMERDKECKGSVRFAAPKWEPGKEQLAVDNVYVSRTTPGIDTAKAVLVTVEVVP
jgi:hypothetical protein